MATIFPNYLQRAAAEIAKATPAKRLELASTYVNTITSLPKYQSAAEATTDVNAGILVNGSVYHNLGGKAMILAVAKGSKKVIIKDPVKQK